MNCRNETIIAINIYYFEAKRAVVLHSRERFTHEVRKPFSRNCCGAARKRKNEAEFIRHTRGGINCIVQLFCLFAATHVSHVVSHRGSTSRRNVLHSFGDSTDKNIFRDI